MLWYVSNEKFSITSQSLFSIKSTNQIKSRNLFEIWYNPIIGYDEGAKVNCVNPKNTNEIQK